MWPGGWARAEASNGRVNGNDRPDFGESCPSPAQQFELRIDHFDAGGRRRSTSLFHEAQAIARFSRLRGSLHEKICTAASRCRPEQASGRLHRGHAQLRTAWPLATRTRSVKILFGRTSLIAKNGCDSFIAKGKIAEQVFQGVNLRFASSSARCGPHL